MRQCINSDCNFRFPTTSSTFNITVCPMCGDQVKMVATMIHQSAGHGPLKVVEPLYQIEALLDNVRSALNVGSIFRTADGCGISHLYLCGITATPENQKVSKTALGAEMTIPWSYHQNAIQAACTIKEQGKQLWALESCGSSQNLFSAIQEIQKTPIVLITGNELTGIDPDLLSECQRVVNIPMMGVKHSLNVAVAFGIASYFLRFALDSQRQAVAAV